MDDIKNMRKEQQLDYAIIKMAQLSEMLLKQRETQNYEDLGKVEYKRRAGIVAELLLACNILWEDAETKAEQEERRERVERQRVEKRQKEQDEKDKEILRLSTELRETKKKNSRLFLALTSGGKNGVQHN